MFALIVYDFSEIKNKTHTKKCMSMYSLFDKNHQLNVRTIVYCFVVTPKRKQKDEIICAMCM